MRPPALSTTLSQAVYAGGQVKIILAWDFHISPEDHMPKGYRHLTYDKRCQIYALLKSAHAKTEIAQLLGVHRSTITNELKRNTGGKGYRYLQAQEKASARRAAASGAPRKMKPGLVREIEEKLTQEQWAPSKSAAG